MLLVKVLASNKLKVVVSNRHFLLIIKVSAVLRKSMIMIICLIHLVLHTKTQKGNFKIGNVIKLGDFSKSFTVLVTR